MRWLSFAVWVLVFAGAFGLGAWLGQGRPGEEGQGEEGADRDERGRRRATVVIGVCLGVILLRVLLRPSLEFALFPFDAYALVRPWWPVPFALALLGAGSRQLETREARRGLVVFAGLLFFASSYPLLRTALFDPDELTGQVGRDGVCLQTTDYTCGAAAAATLLAHHGIEASEREMAERCWTNALTGTDVFCVARGLRQKLAGSGRAVRLEQGGWELLADRRQPALATVKFGLMVDHWVCVCEVTDDRVVLGDPLAGARVLPKAEFLAIWRGGLLTIDEADERDAEDRSDPLRAPPGRGADRYTMVAPARTWVVANWLQHYDLASFRAELAGHGLRVLSHHADVAGAPFDAAAHQLAVVAGPS